MTTRRWIDWVNILLGLWLIVAPWVLSSTAIDGLAALNSRSVGIGLVALAALAMYRPTVLGDAIGVTLGIWLIASPWILGFDEWAVAPSNDVIVGPLVIGYALWAMRIDTRPSANVRGLNASYV
jgi:SPW repeat